MKQQELDMLDDEKLIWICVEPTVQKVRGKEPGIKSKVIKKLNDGQRALFLFQVLYGHADQGISRFFLQISYLVETTDIWSALKSAMKYFDDTEMLGLIQKMEQAHHEVIRQNTNTISLDELDKQYKERIPATLKLIGSHIRNNPQVFMQFKD